MTTATLKSTPTTKPTIPTTDALLADVQRLRAEIQRAQGAMLDARDVPGSWTGRQKNLYEERRVRLPQHLTLCSNLAEQLTKAVATRARCLPARDRLRAAHATIEKQIEQAPDHRLIVDARASKQEWARQNGLHASLTAIARGVEYFGGAPALPSPLRELLTDTCPSCGHAELAWPGPAGPLEEDLAKAEAFIATAPASLASLRASAGVWLAEPDPVTS